VSCFIAFLGVFSCNLKFCYSHPHPHSPSSLKTFSECWLVSPLQLSFSSWLKPPVRSLRLTAWNLLKYTRIENGQKLHKKIFVFYYVAVICINSGETEQIRACVSCYDQSAETANYWRSSKWCTYCMHRGAAVLAYTQGCHIKNETKN